MTTEAFETYIIPQERFARNVKHLFDIHLPEELYDVIEKMRSGSKKFGDCCYLRQGVIALPKDKYVVPTKQAYEKLDAESQNLCKKVLEGKDVHRYSISWKAKYLIYKEDELHRPRTKDIFERQKLIIPRIATRLRAAYDDKDFYCLERLYVVYSRNNSFDLKFLLGVLNSKLVNFYYKTQYSPTHLSGAYLKYYKTYLEQIPIKETHPDNKPLRDKIIGWVNELQLAHQQVKDYEEKIGGFPNSYLTGNEELAILRDIIRRKEFSKNSFTPSTKLRTHYYRDLGENDVFRIILDEKNYVEFLSQQIATFVFETLKDRTEIASHELLTLGIPSPEKAEILLSQLANDRNRLKHLQGKIGELDKEIDTAVYDFYGITYKERRLIQNYLKLH